MSRRRLRIAFVTVLSACVTVQLVLALGAIGYRTADLALVEPNVIYAIERTVVGHPLYEDPERPPFSVVQYSPFYYVAAARMTSALGISPATDVWRVYAVARSISLVSWILTALLVHVLATRILGLQWIAGFTIACLTIVVPSVAGVAARPDSLVRLLTLAAFTLYLAADAGSRGRRLTCRVAAVLLLVLAIWTKQTALEMVVVFVVLSAVQRRWRDLAGMTAVFLAAHLAIFAVSRDALGGTTAIYQNVVRGAAGCALHIEWGVNTMREFFVAFGPLLSLFLAALYLYGRQPVQWSSNATRMFLAAVVMLGFCAIGFPHYGIGINHAYEAVMLMLLALAVYHHEQPFQAGQPQTVSFAGALALMTYVALYASSQTAFSLYDNHNIVWHRRLDREQIATQERLVQDLQVRLATSPESQVFAYWLPYVNVRLFERAVAPQVEIVQNCTYPNKVLDYRRLVEDVRTGKIRFVATQATQMLRSYAGADFGRFTRLGTFGGFVILGAPD